ncbi:hypothetical protein MZP00_25560, partial [Escherichia coli]
MKTGAEAIRALATQLPVFRQKLSDGWYQVRIAGRDVSTSGLTAQLHEKVRIAGRDVSTSGLTAQLHE